MKSIEKLSENEKKFLLALVKDGNKTDARIAEETGMSKATANRIRRKFEEEGTLQEYIPIVNLEHMGIELYAVITIQADGDIDRQDIASDPHVIFIGDTDDIDETILVFAGFQGYDQYHRFVDGLKEDYRGEIASLDSSIIGPEKIVKNDFTHLIKHVLTDALGDDDA